MCAREGLYRLQYTRKHGQTRDWRVCVLSATTGRATRPNRFAGGFNSSATRPPWCVFMTAVPITKLFAWGEGDSGGHVLRETTSRGLCALVCPSRTSEHHGVTTKVPRGGVYGFRAIFCFCKNKIKGIITMVIGADKFSGKTAERADVVTSRPRSLVPSVTPCYTNNGLKTQQTNDQLRP